MITKINNKKRATAQKIRSIFQAAYIIEAEMLQVVNFPPLKRSIQEFIDSNNDFYSYFKNEEVAGIVEVENSNKNIHIQSLVVYPKYFRQGIARALVSFVLESCQFNIVTVETGLDNLPAIQLYKSFEFKEVKQWDTNHGVRKIKFQIKN